MATNADVIRKIIEQEGKKEQQGAQRTARPASQGGSYMQSGTLHDRIRQKIARGEPLTPEELDLL